MINQFKHNIYSNIKNLYGWKTRRKIIVFSVDDYGNVRIESKKARDNMNAAGMKVHNRFDVYDCLETRTDLEMLFDTLKSVTDMNGNHAVFTAFSVICNIDFEKLSGNGYCKYICEQLPDTFNRLAEINYEAYAGTWNLWKEGIKTGLLIPQFHGREHINLKIFSEKLEARDPELITSLENQSFTSISDSGYKTIAATAAFDFDEFTENDKFSEIIKDGLNRFEQVFGFRAVHFTPPVFNCHPVNHKHLFENGIKYIDTALTRVQHQGDGKYKREFSYTGKRNGYGQIFIVRNVVFEPSDDRISDWVTHTMEQIEAAFRWNRPAIISSHRVNFCGHINERNRETGLTALKALLNDIVKRWPDVEFMAANKLGDLIQEESN